MTSKWKWISDKLKELHHDSLSEKAIEIHEALNSIYGCDVTPYFEKDEEEIEREYSEISDIKNKLEYINEIANDTNYCVACYEHNCDCYTCIFGRAYGGCRESEESLYGKFYIQLSSLIDD